MGHATLDTTQIYTGVSESQKRAGIQSLATVTSPNASGRGRARRTPALAEGVT